MHAVPRSNEEVTSNAKKKDETILRSVSQVLVALIMNSAVFVFRIRLEQEIGKTYSRPVKKERRRVSYRNLCPVATLLVVPNLTALFIIPKVERRATRGDLDQAR